MTRTSNVEATLVSKNRCFKRSPRTGRPANVSLVDRRILRRELAERGLDVGASVSELQEFCRCCGKAAISDGDVDGEGTDAAGEAAGESAMEAGDSGGAGPGLASGAGESYMAISSIASSSELPGSSPLISSSESVRVDDGAWDTGNSCADSTSSSSSSSMPSLSPLPFPMAMTWASSSRADRPPCNRPSESYR